MSEHVTLGPPTIPPPAPPAWLKEKVLRPGEQVVWWQGPIEKRWQQWCKDHDGVLIMPAFFSIPILALLGRTLGPAGLFIGGALGVVAFVTALILVSATDRYKRYVLTDRRLLVLVGRSKTEEFDLALLRQILTSLGSVVGAVPGAQPADLSKLGQFQAIGQTPSQAVTDLTSILAMVKLAQQLQGITSADERPTG